MEATHRERMRTLLQSSGNPCARDHFSPGHFTASGFVLTTDGRLLLIFHRKLQRWLQPGGHVDPADGSLLDAARREVQEETGIRALTLIGDGPIDLDVHGIPVLGEEPAHEHFDVRFAFRADPGELAPSDEVEGARWVPLAEVEQIDSDASVMRAVQKLLQTR
jgi:8-oxo-dGTP pyrophosphatase MutT (NUDIX family)